MVSHWLDPPLFDELARGGGGPQAIAALRRAQLSKHLLLIKRVLGHWPGPGDERDAVEDAFERSRQRDPVRFAEVLGSPLVGAWAAIVNRALLRGTASPEDLGHLAAWAMVACAATEVDGDAAVPVRDGQVHVPNLGAASVPDDTARLVVRDGRLEVRTRGVIVEADAESPEWLPVRGLNATAAGRDISLGLDDLDPYRHGHHAPPATRLPDAEVVLWRSLFAEAWQMLAEQLPSRAAELATGLRTLVPLVPGTGRGALSATLRHAFGVFGLTRPPLAAEFAVTLVHEFQHSKLSAVLDLVPLTDPADGRRYFAPWRVDPRPLAGLLQGVYAFVGVADTWRALRAVGGLATLAERQFAEARLQVDRGLTEVEQSGALLPAGVVPGLRRAADALLAETVPIATARAAERALIWRREQWLLRNGPEDGWMDTTA
jgi:HEXXH motif-containing protein